MGSGERLPHQTFPILELVSVIEEQDEVFVTHGVSAFQWARSVSGSFQTPGTAVLGVIR